MKDCCGIFMAFTLHITLKYFSGHYDTICVTSAAKITSPTFWVYTKTTLFVVIFLHNYSSANCTDNCQTRAGNNKWLNVHKSMW